MLRTMRIVMVLGTLAWSASALGDEPGASSSPVDKYGLSMAAGGGVGGFTANGMRSVTGTQGLWDLHAAFGTKSMVGVELGYTGSAQDVNALGLKGNALLLSTGFDADVRVSVARIQGIQPYVFAGIGWRRYDISNASANTSDVANVDNVLEIPLGLGATYYVGHFLIDLRGSFRPTFDANLVPTTNGGSQDMHNWNVLARGGWEF